jgi:wyosine [tRNA(Phe)-imidazoG37] synthetase (radical SAM superfamily)
MTEPSANPSAPLSEQNHPRLFRANTYVYPVLSRRSKGVSVGINLNPDKVCNFDCIYCQVDRTKAPQEFFVGLPKLLAELQAVLTGLLPGGWLWSEPEFASLPTEKRAVADIAFSGDGEPTTFKNFSEVIERCIEVKESAGQRDAKVVLITNATGFDRPDVKRGLDFMAAHRGEIWAKLDAGSAGYFALIDNTSFPFEKVLANIVDAARRYEIVIQSCFMKVKGAGPSAVEIGEFVQRLREIGEQGGRIRLVQAYTVARNPALSIVSSLSPAEVDGIAQRVRTETGLPAEAYYGDVPEGQGHEKSAPA